MKKSFELSDFSRNVATQEQEQERQRKLASIARKSNQACNNKQAIQACVNRYAIKLQEKSSRNAELVRVKLVQILVDIFDEKTQTIVQRMRKLCLKMLLEHIETKETFELRLSFAKRIRDSRFSIAYAQHSQASKLVKRIRSKIYSHRHEDTLLNVYYRNKRTYNASRYETVDDDSRDVERFENERLCIESLARLVTHSVACKLVQELRDEMNIQRNDKQHSKHYARAKRYRRNK